MNIHVGGGGSRQRRSGRKRYDIPSVLRVGAVVLLIFSFSLSAVRAFSPEMSYKEFLDTYLLDSLDGDLTGLSPGDSVVVHDRVWKIEHGVDGDVLYLQSVRGTEYFHTGLPVNGQVPPGVGEGTPVEVTIHIGLGDEGKDAVLPLSPGDIVPKEGGWLWP